MSNVPSKAPRCSQICQISYILLDCVTVFAFVFVLVLVVVPIVVVLVVIVFIVAAVVIIDAANVIATVMAFDTP